jgi:hypothetical protein
MHLRTLYFATWLTKQTHLSRSWRRSPFITSSRCGKLSEGLSRWPTLRAIFLSPVLHLNLACFLGSLIMFKILSLINE